MPKFASTLLTCVLSAAFGLSGAVGGLLLLGPHFKGETGPRGPRGVARVRGPQGPIGPTGTGLDSLNGAYVIASKFGCPPGTYGIGTDSVVLAAPMTVGASNSQVQTAQLCEIQGGD